MSWTKDVQAAHGVGTCQDCGTRYTLTKRGLVRTHGPQGGRRCFGSGRLPKESRPEAPARNEPTYEEIAAEKRGSDR